MDRYLDDFTIGEHFESRSITVTAEEIVAFARQFDPQYYHLDPSAALSSAFGGLIASGFHTLCLTMRLFFDLDLWPKAIVASPGMETIQWIKPLRPGDTIRSEAEIVDVRVSKSKPDRGLVTTSHKTWNQSRDLILSARCLHMLRRRDVTA